MSLSLYEASVPVFVRALHNLSAILEKARTFADEKGIPHGELIGARLIEDMDPLPAQIQRASDAAKLAVIRLADLAPVPMEDKEQSFDELQARIAATIAVLTRVAADAMDGREDAQVELKMPKGTLHFTARDYLLGFAIPNFFFHVTAAYALLRMKGVPVGKLDFLGPLPQPQMA
jgi:hypothetical protein